MSVPILRFDKEWDAATAHLRSRWILAHPQTPGEVQTVRDAMKSLKPILDALAEGTKGIGRTVYHAQAKDGHQIPIYAFMHDESKAEPASVPSPAILHLHAGGMIAGSPDVFSGPLKILASTSGVPIFSVDYRLAPEFSHPYSVEDACAGLLWLGQNAEKFKIDPSRIIVYGESAGGGVAAGAALMARDQRLSPPLAQQILLSPMLDDRITKLVKALEPWVSWTYAENSTGWHALLGNDIGTERVSPYSARARAKTVEGLPPTHLDVGTLDIFRDENIQYVVRLAAANVETEFHLYPGLQHGFEGVGAATEVARQATQNRMRATQRV